MFSGEHINITEDRAVLHVALRAPRNKVSMGHRSACMPRGVKPVPVAACAHPSLEACSMIKEHACVNMPVVTAQEMTTDGKNVVPDVWEVLDKIKGFTDKVGCHPMFQALMSHSPGVQQCAWASGSLAGAILGTSDGRCLFAMTCRCVRESGRAQQGRR